MTRPTTWWASVPLIFLLIPAMAWADEKIYWYDGDVRRTANVVESASEDVIVGVAAVADPVFEYQGQRMRLPGGLVIRFRDTWSDDQIEAWLNENRHDQARPLFGSQTYFVPTESGWESLTLANRLHESGIFEYVSPNWAREKAVK